MAVDAQYVAEFQDSGTGERLSPDTDDWVSRAPWVTKDRDERGVAIVVLRIQNRSAASRQIA